MWHSKMVSVKEKRVRGDQRNATSINQSPVAKKNICTSKFKQEELKFIHLLLEVVKLTSLLKAVSVG